MLASLLAPNSAKYGTPVEFTAIPYGSAFAVGTRTSFTSPVLGKSFPIIRRKPQTGNHPKDGRSPGYSVEVAETICERLINGESLRAICADPRMPAKATVFRWLASNQEFRRSYALARECQAEDGAVEILEIADDSSRDYVKKTGADGKVTWVFDKEHIARQALKIKALKWTMDRPANDSPTRRTGQGAMAAARRRDVRPRRADRPKRIRFALGR